MIKNWVVYLAALLCAVLFYIFYAGWISWYLLILAVCLPFFSLLVSLGAMLQVSPSAGMQPLCKRGQPLTLRLGETSSRLFPAPRYRFRMRLTYPMSGAQTVQSVRLSGSLRQTQALDTSHCGAVICAFERGRVYDYLGLFRLPMQLPRSCRAFILPTPVPPEPEPDLSELYASTFHPMRGGGFSEIHEMRQYQPGDRMQSMHWKLSAKLDQPIVREPQQPNRGRVVLSFDLKGPQAELDQTLDQLTWLSEQLLSRDVRHEIRWLDPASHEPCRAVISCLDDYHSLLAQLLVTPLLPGVPSMADRIPEQTVWRYHVCPTQAGREEASCP